jgi:DNA-binding transcriptional MerR regulator
MTGKAPEAFRTISEVSEILDTPPHVLRFWESKFTQLRPVKRAGGRRYYRPADLALLAGIRQLLHVDGMTIRGVQKLLREKGARHVATLVESPEAVRAGAAAHDFLEGTATELEPEADLADEPGPAAETGDVAPAAEFDVGSLRDHPPQPAPGGKQAAETHTEPEFADEAEPEPGIPSEPEPGERTGTQAPVPEIEPSPAPETDAAPPAVSGDVTAEVAAAGQEARMTPEAELSPVDAPDDLTGAAIESAPPRPPVGQGDLFAAMQPSEAAPGLQALDMSDAAAEDTEELPATEAEAAPHPERSSIEPEAPAGPPRRLATLLRDLDGQAGDAMTDAALRRLAARLQSLHERLRAAEALGTAAARAGDRGRDAP